MSRKQMILATVLAVQVLLLVLLRLPGSGSAEAGSVRPLLPELENLNAARLVIESGEGDTVALARSGESWTLEEADGFPADGSKVDTMLNDLKALKVRRPVVTSSRYHAQLKVSEEDNERRIRIWDDAEAGPAVDLLVGNAPNYRISSVRRQGEDEVYEVMGLSGWDVQAKQASWIDSKLVDLPADQVTALEVTNSHGRFRLEKAGGTWSVVAGAAPGDLDQGEVDALVRAYASVYMADPVGRVNEAEQGLEQPAAVVQITVTPPVEPPPAALAEAGSEGGEAPAAALPEPQPEVTTLRIGSFKDEAAGVRYAAVSGFDFAVTLNKFDVERATDKKLADLMAEETPVE